MKDKHAPSFFESDRPMTLFRNRLGHSFDSEGEGKCFAEWLPERIKTLNGPRDHLDFGKGIMLNGVRYYLIDPVSIGEPDTGHEKCHELRSHLLAFHDVLKDFFTRHLVQSEKLNALAKRIYRDDPIRKTFFKIAAFLASLPPLHAIKAMQEYGMKGIRVVSPGGISNRAKYRDCGTSMMIESLAHLDQSNLACTDTQSSIGRGNREIAFSPLPPSGTRGKKTVTIKSQKNILILSCQGSLAYLKRFRSSLILLLLKDPSGASHKRIVEEIWWGKAWKDKTPHHGAPDKLRTLVKEINSHLTSIFQPPLPILWIKSIPGYGYCLSSDVIWKDYIEYQGKGETMTYGSSPDEY